MRRILGVVALVAVSGGAVAIAPPAAAAPVVRLPPAIDATGRTDVTDALNGFFAGLAPGTTVELPRDGTLRAEGTVVLSGRRDVTVDGRGARLVARTDGAGVTPAQRGLRRNWPRNRSHLKIEASAGVTVRDLTIAGPNASGAYRAALEAQAAFFVTRSSDVTLDHVAVEEVHGDGLYVVGQSETVRLRDCAFSRIGRQGVAVVSGEHVVVERCEMDGIGRSAIDLEPGRGFARDVRVRDSTFRDVTNFLLAAVGAGSEVGDVRFERNRVHGGRGVSAYVGVPRFVRSGFHFVDNVGTGTSAGYEGALMRFERVDGVEIRGNEQAVARGVTPVVLENSCNEAVSGNDFPGAAGTVRRSGDCGAPGTKPATSTPRRATGPDAARPPGRGTGAGRATSTTTTTTAPRVVVRTVTDSGGGTSPVTVAVAFGGGALVGATAMLLWQRRRRRSGAG